MVLETAFGSFLNSEIEILHLSPCSLPSWFYPFLIQRRFSSFAFSGPSRGMTKCKCWHWSADTALVTCQKHSNGSKTNAKEEGTEANSHSRQTPEITINVVLRERLPPWFAVRFSWSAFHSRLLHLVGPPRANSLRTVRILMPMRLQTLILFVTILQSIL